ncbi:MAG: hypothetical protein HKN32_01490 [Flavobacteriales bacterium]|nr:hypothetical protein [Flavobacteriales bacterium]
MRNWIFLIGLFVSATGWSQTDGRLQGLFSDAQITSLQKSSPQVLDFWTFVADNAVLVMDEVAEKKQADLSDLPTLTLNNTFNILEQTELITGNRTYYRDEITGNLIMIRSMKELVTDFNGGGEKQ